MVIIDRIKNFFSGSKKTLKINMSDYTYKYAGHTIEPKFDICAKFYFDAYSKNGRYIKRNFVLIIFSSDAEVHLNRKLFKISPHIKKALELRTFDEIVEQAKKISTYEDILVWKGGEHA